MSLSIRHLLAFFLQFGWFGILLLAIADDSFLFLPIGSDLLTVILVARHHDQLPLYVLAAATGSTIGVFLLDLVCRKGGEESLKRLVKPKLLDYLERQMKKHAAAALVISCLAPPPFPFGTSIAAASAFQYPKPRPHGSSLRGPCGSIFLGWVGGNLFRSSDSADRGLSRVYVVHGWFHRALRDRKHCIDHSPGAHRPFTITARASRP